MDEADVFESALYDARVGKGSVARLESLANALLDGTGLNLEKISEMSPEGLRAKIIAACERKRISDVFSQDSGLLLLVKEAAKNAEKELVNIPLRDIRKSAEANISGTFGDGSSDLRAGMWLARQAASRNAKPRGTFQPGEKKIARQSQYSC